MNHSKAYKRADLAILRAAIELTNKQSIGLSAMIGELACLLDSPNYWAESSKVQDRIRGLSDALLSILGEK